MEAVKETISRILVALDADDLEGDEKNEPTPALQVASDLAVKLGSELRLVHVYHHPSLTMPLESMALLEGPYVDELARILEVESETLQKGRDRLQIVSKIEPGDPVEVLLSDSVKVPCQLLVLGTHGRGGVKRALVGSVAEEVVRRSSVPVLTMNPNVQLHGKFHPKKILVPIDIREPSFERSQKAFQVGLDFARFFSSSIQLIHVLEEWAYPIVQPSSMLAGGVYLPLEKEHALLKSERALDLKKFVEMFETTGVDVETKVIDGRSSVSESILEVEKKFGSDLIVMSHRRLSRLKTAVLGSVNRQVIRRALSPVLSIP